VKKMSNFVECPNCAKDGLKIPISEGYDGLVCSMCNSVFKQ
jgi:hypothetical protein